MFLYHLCFIYYFEQINLQCKICLSKTAKHLTNATVITHFHLFVSSDIVSFFPLFSNEQCIKIKVKHTHDVYIPLGKLQEQVNLLYVPRPTVMLSLQQRLLLFPSIGICNTVGMTINISITVCFMVSGVQYTRVLI